MREVVIVEAGRSAVGRKNGTLSGLHPADALGPVQMEVIRSAGLTPDQIDHVVGGCIGKVGAQAMNITRTAWLSHGGPQDTASSTVDAQCGSSQYALNLAYSLIASGAEDTVLACGVENMSMVPIGADANAGAKAGHGKPLSRTYRNHYEFVSQFEGAERICDVYGITREQADQFGLQSQLRARRALDEGRFETQIIGLDAPVLDSEGNKTDETDQLQPRRDPP